MAKNGLQHDVWVLICDGRKALLAENEGDAAAPNLKVRQNFEHPDLPTREQGTDVPGRLFASTGERRGATDSTDFQELAEEDFLKNMAGHLDRAVAENRIKDLIVAAPPRALGVLRRAFSPAVRKVLRREVEKDYVRMPMHEVERHLGLELR